MSQLIWAVRIHCRKDGEVFTVAICSVTLNKLLGGYHLVIRIVYSSGSVLPYDTSAQCCMLNQGSCIHAY